MPNRVYIPVNTAEYAKLYGVSQRTAQRRLPKLPGAVKSERHGRWNIPLSSKQYAEAKGVSQTTARRHGVRLPTLADFAKVVNDRDIPKLEREAAAHYISLLQADGKDVNAETITDGMRRSSRTQLRRYIKLKFKGSGPDHLKSGEIDDMTAEQWQDENEDSTGWYH